MQYLFCLSCVTVQRLRGDHFWMLDEHNFQEIYPRSSHWIAHGFELLQWMNPNQVCTAFVYLCRTCTLAERALAIGNKQENPSIIRNGLHLSTRDTQHCLY